MPANVCSVLLTLSIPAVTLIDCVLVTVHVVGVMVIVGALLLFAPKQPVGFFFARVTSNSEGWPYWWAFVVGFAVLHGLNPEAGIIHPRP